MPAQRSIQLHRLYYQKFSLATQNMKVVMSEDAQSLNELVVVGYQTQRKADLQGAVAVVSTKSLKTSADTDPIQRLCKAG